MADKNSAIHVLLGKKVLDFLAHGSLEELFADLKNHDQFVSLHEESEVIMNDPKGE